MNNNIFLEFLLNYLKDMKKEIEADGLIATADEMIERVEFVIEQNSIAKTND